MFGNIEIEDVVQVGDKTRINCVKSFLQKGEAAFSLCEIQPEASAAFISVATTSVKDFYLDWQYSTPGTKTISLRLTNGGLPVTFTQTIEVVSIADDKLLSKDSDLTAIEPDILKWIPQGRNTFINVHRQALKDILDWLDMIRVWKNDGSKLTKADIGFTDDLNRLSVYITLSHIFMGISNKVDDTFLAKSKTYNAKAEELQNRGRIQADLNGDDELDSSDNVDMKSFTMVRR